MSVKQVIVVRKDLKMRKGKLAAQVAHAAMKILLDGAYTADVNFDGGDMEALVIPLENEGLKKWLRGPFTKVVVGCKDEEELLDLAEQSRKLGFPTALITDSGATEFHGVPTKTCVAIGPASSVAIDELTGNLKLM